MKRLVQQSISLLAKVALPFAALLFMVHIPLELVQEYAGHARWFGSENSRTAFSLLTLCALPVINGSLIVLAADADHGRPLLVGEAVRRAVKAWPNLIVAYVILSLIVLGWIAVFALPGAVLLRLMGTDNMYWLALAVLPTGFLVAPGYLFLDQVVMLEGLEPYAARRRTAELGRGRRGFLFVVAILVFGPPLALELAGEMFVGPLAEHFGVAAWLLAALLAIAASMLYAVELIVAYVIYRRLTAPDRQEHIP